jgi:serine protease Do
LKLRCVILFWLISAVGQAAEIAAVDRLGLAARTTFEVVLEKRENNALKYEKPLPLELLSFTERNDKYWSIGTAFAFDANTFVSAAHVLISGLGGSMGKPSLRDGQGNIYALDKVLRFSLHEDFIVFTVKNPPKTQALIPNEQPTVGTAVYAVGNALGEGVVIRDGLLTSQTPEAQDGRWKWLRFSAAASPGNSGGPLLDNAGRVIGVITAKSPNENLNYALPIAEVIRASDRQATIDTRESFGLPILRSQSVVRFNQQFPLPVSWEGFSTTLIKLRHDFFLKSSASLLSEQAQLLPPNGKSARLLATLDRSMDVALIAQQNDDNWGLESGAGEYETELPNDGNMWISSLKGATAFRLQRSAKSADASFYHNPEGLMDQLLLGLKLPRTVGTQNIRITSMGTPFRTQQHADRFDRTWQEYAWALGYADIEILVHALPTPEGYIGFVRYSTSDSSESVRTELRLLADYLHVYYRGSIKQWRTLLAERDLSPQLLRGASIRNDERQGFGLRLPNASVNIPRDVVSFNDESPLMLFLGYRSDGKNLAAELRGFTAFEKKKDSSSVGVWGQPKPADSAGSRLTERWDDMVNRRDAFAGGASHDAQFTSFWTRSAVGDAGHNFMFEVYMGLEEKGLVPRQVTERRDQLLSGFKTSPTTGK